MTNETKNKVWDTTRSISTFLSLGIIIGLLLVTPFSTIFYVLGFACIVNPLVLIVVGRLTMPTKNE